MRCFVTGGTGFLGSHIVKELTKKGHEVTVLIRRTSNMHLIESIGANTVFGDVTDLESLAQGIPDDIDWFFHNAAIMADWGGKKHFFPVNVDGTKNILEIVRKKEIPQLMYTSSTAVYGFPNKIEAITEDWPCKPHGFYQKSKLAAEKLIQDYCETYGIETTFVRPPMILGHGDMYTIPIMIDYFKKNGIMYIGDGSNYNSFAHAEDVARLLILTAEEFRKSKGRAYNAVSFTSTMKHFNDCLAKELGIDNPKVRKFPYRAAVVLGTIMERLYGAFLRPNPPLITSFRAKYFGSNYIVDGSRATRELGFEPKWNLESSIRDAVQWGGFLKPR